MSRSRAANDVPGYRGLCRLERPLEREEEADLARRWQCSRDRNAADKLMRAEAGRVLAMALRYRRYGLPISELVAEGNFGFVRALGKFDPERGSASPRMQPTGSAPVFSSTSSNPGAWSGAARACCARGCSSSCVANEHGSPMHWVKVKRPTVKSHDALAPHQRRCSKWHNG